ncbi:hypothetical protein ACBJ59_30360 [Nonomuraea sp. MTCD27]
MSIACRVLDIQCRPPGRAAAAAETRPATVEKDLPLAGRCHEGA